MYIYISICIDMLNDVIPSLGSTRIPGTGLADIVTVDRYSPISMPVLWPSR